MIKLPVSFALFRRAFGFALLVCLLPALGAAEAAKINFNVAAGDAGKTLKQFAQQATREIMFPVQRVDNIKTNAVAGELTVKEGLDRLLAGTNLRAFEDEKTGALIVQRDDDPNVPRAAQTEKSDRPGNLAITNGNKPTGSESETLVLSTFSVSTKQDKGYLAGNSVSATRIDTPIKNLPFSINAFTEQFIQDTGAGDLQDVVKYAPGVTGAGREFVSGNTRFNIRGFDTTSPQRNGFVGARYVDPVNIQRVEVVKGPASLLYGAIEPGGTVNYITKKPFDKTSLQVKQDFGTLEYWRTQVDLNVPLVAGKLFVRFNGAWQNGPNATEQVGDVRWVMAPSLTWRISRDHALTLDYDHHTREERTPFNTVPSIVVVSHNISSAANAANPTAVRRLTDPVATTFDYGLLYPFPLPKDFNWTGNDDWRTSEVDSLNAEYTGKLGKDWTVRANAAFNRNDINNKATGIGDINSYAPGTANSSGTIDPATLPGATTAEKTAYLDNLARAFAARVLADPSVVFESPYIFQVRRKRVTANMSESRSYQVELAGNLEFAFGKIKPLIGIFRQENSGESFNRQSTTNPPAGVANEATTPVQNFQTWNYLNLASRTLNESYDENTLPLQASATNDSTDTAYYAVLNGSFFQERLFVVAGARYSQAEATSFNRRTGNPGNDFEISDTSLQGGVGYKLLPSLLAFGSYSESFVPSNALLSLNGQPAGPAKPVTSDGIEFGLKTDFLDGRISSTISYFEINQLDRISRFSIPDPVTGTTLSSVIQGTKDKSSGFEIDLTLSPVNHWQTYVSFSQINARTLGAPPALSQAIGKKIENSAEYLFNVWTRYNFTSARLKGLWVGGGVNYTSEKKLSIANPDLFFEPVTIWDAALGYNWKVGKAAWSATFNWKNVTDEIYLTGLIGHGLPERAWITLSVKL